MEPEDGVVELAMGLGAIIAEGGRTHRFSPRYPEMNPPYSSAVEFMEESQNRFYALDLTKTDFKVKRDEKFDIMQPDLSAAEEDGTLFFVAGTFSGEDNAIRDTISIKGPRVLTFANLLKYNLFPLADILTEILKIGRESFGSHVEIEFALNLFKDKTRKPEFYLLQIRPMVVGRESVEISLDDINPEDVICLSRHSMGNGIFNNLRDLVYVDPDSFDRSKTRLIAQEVGELNQTFIKENRRYILIGFGRWGTFDPWLGIPVEWHQMSKAQLVIEANRKNFHVEPSLGSHFFHNLTSLGMGYFHVAGTGESNSDKEFILWDWLKKQEIHKRTKHLIHIRFADPFEVKINARGATGVIMKPGV
jgi:hypothetical protein